MRKHHDALYRMYEDILDQLEVQMTPKPPTCSGKSDGALVREWCYPRSLKTALRKRLRKSLARPLRVYRGSPVAEVPTSNKPVEQKASGVCRPRGP